ncbi:hypothetical protein [Nakamurella endophytica]|uniref:hypothetical protein n=1 Tax=Nakamurella endophytica TaxID=1748367 RepID=UPI00166ACA24|nr:hypothetical protein [Nakamurella endophytica]
MDRRRAGWVVVAVAVLAAAGLPAAGGRWIGGSAAIAPVAPAPAVGQCVTVDRNDPVEIRRTGAGVIQIPAVHPIDCRFAHDGEVTSVLERPDAFTPLDYFAPPTADFRSCGAPAQAYLGLTEPSSGRSRFSPWAPVGVGAAQGAGPDARQRAAGQRWRACVLLPAGAHRYPGSAAGAFDGGVLPASWATCTLQVFPLWRSSVPCSGRHTVEIFGVAPVAAAADAAALRRLETACRGLVAAATRMPDPAAGGALRVAVRVEHYDRSGRPIEGPPTAADQQGRAGCVVQSAAGRPLGRTLAGLGAAPLPWTG